MATALPEPLRRDLAALQKATETGAEDPALLDEALHAANTAGWTYRQLCEALGVSRTYISDRINRAAGTGTGFGFTIPGRRRPAGILTPRPLPGHMAEDLRTLLARAVSDRSGERTAHGLSPAAAAWFQALRAAADAGWDAYETAVPLDVYPRAAARFAKYHGTEAEGPAPHYPAPPERTEPAAWNARYPETPPVTIPGADAARLRELAGTAHLNRGIPRDSEEGPPDAATEYTTLLARWYLHGASRQELERASGQGWEALRKRLSRWGYMGTGRTG